MTVRFFHTADWHLGQLFHNYPRDYEHTQFLAWLIAQIKEKQPHALLIAGDIFDVINPSSQAQKQLNRFLADAHEVAPQMQTLLIAGNHDSGYRIEQVEPLLEKFNAKTVGLVHWHEDKTLNTERLIQPIYQINAESNQREIVAWCVTLPFLRPAEITGFNADTTDHQSAIRYIHQQLINEAKQCQTGDQALIIMSHAHMQGGQESESERPIVVGNQEALSSDLFGDDIDYVALGHLHKPQNVGQDHIRYSGSPIPLSFSERNYPHQVLHITLDPTKKNDEKLTIEALKIPRTIDLKRITGELDNVMQQLRTLPAEVKECENSKEDLRDFLEIEYISDRPAPLDLRQQIEQALPANCYRLLRIQRKTTAQNANINTATSKIDLAPPTPTELFQHIWAKQGFSADQAVEQDFQTVLDEAQQRQFHPTES